jgi:hypothetical protein
MVPGYERNDERTDALLPFQAVAEKFKYPLGDWLLAKVWE